MDPFEELIREASEKLRRLDARAVADLRDRIIPELQDYEPVIARAVGVALDRQLLARAPRKTAPTSMHKASPRGDSAQV